MYIYIYISKREAVSGSISMKINEKSMKINANQWKSLKISENHWKSMKLISKNHGKSMKNQWKSMKINEHINENQWKINENQWLWGGGWEAGGRAGKRKIIEINAK